MTEEPRARRVELLGLVSVRSADSIVDWRTQSPVDVYVLQILTVAQAVPEQAERHYASCGRG